MPSVATELPAPAAADWGFPRSATAILVLVEYAGSRGVGARRALAGTGLHPEDLVEGEVTAAQELTVVRTLRGLLGEVGVDVGQRYRASTFGAFGFAMLASRTVLDAMDLALRFIDLSFAFAIPRASVVGDEVVVTVDGGDLPADVRRFLVERDVTAVVAVLDGLVPGGVGARVTWTEHAARIEFGADQLSRPLPERSPERLELAARMCAEVVDARRARTGLAQDVRVLITQRLPQGAPMADVAHALALSERTLRRHLADEGVAYRLLLDEVRSSMDLALRGGRATMPVAVVAQRLGYGSSAAYLHARRRWQASRPRS
ncbi:AraC family transcriptional regulator [Nocardioides szechwanensis]|uniref:AraC-type DNA-binding protein n=1 Tax=Nocardioides szechwanensis TaxID=1005944 RepID=A0A1H0I6U8_9ACTN|nr:AraC family transcriptional regulator [Nocardioides szechwanensis]GEP34415.1 AraC family transcriptional regulator [Nocardioides szechwanensis]SDO27117.1 AraC-type DNA-binding protein [Nocardioides szechwanensis]